MAQSSNRMAAIHVGGARGLKYTIGDWFATTGSCARRESGRAVFTTSVGCTCPAGKSAVSDERRGDLAGRVPRGPFVRQRIAVDVEGPRD